MHTALLSPFPNECCYYGTEDSTEDCDEHDDKHGGKHCGFPGERHGDKADHDEDDNVERRGKYYIVDGVVYDENGDVLVASSSTVVKNSPLKALQSAPLTYELPLKRCNLNVGERQ